LVSAASSFILLHACIPVISKDLKANVDPSLTFNKVHQNPIMFKGKFVIWGGEVIETVNQKDGTTLIEIFHRPLVWGDEPDVTLPSEGRFLIIADKYLDPYLFRKGKKITVAGEILGEKIKPVGEMNYRYPLISSKQIHLWPDSHYYPYPADYFYPPWHYDPWWHYYPWRGYPYR